MVVGFGLDEYKGAIEVCGKKRMNLSLYNLSTGLVASNYIQN